MRSKKELVQVLISELETYKTRGAKTNGMCYAINTLYLEDMIGMLEHNLLHTVVDGFQNTAIAIFDAKIDNNHYWWPSMKEDVANIDTRINFLSFIRETL